jgi:hypothetical protein
MSTFEELGKTLDKLVGSDNAKLALRLIEEFTHPRYNVKAEQNKTTVKPVTWISATPKVKVKVVQLWQSNVDSIAKWLIDSAKFEDVIATEDGIYTEWGSISWGEWIAQEDNKAIVFYSQEDFRKNYKIV